MIDLAKTYNTHYSLNLTEDHFKLLASFRLMNAKFNYFKNYLFLFTLLNFESYGLQFFTGLSQILLLPPDTAKEILNEFYRTLWNSLPNFFSKKNPEFIAETQIPYFIPYHDNPTPQQIADLNNNILGFLIAPNKLTLISAFNRQIESNLSLIEKLEAQRIIENSIYIMTLGDPDRRDGVNAGENFLATDKDIQRLKEENKLLREKIKDLKKQ